jgi:TolA-binding protein
MLNLPAGSDIRRMRQQLSRMERRLNQLSHDVSELDDQVPPVRRSQVT